LEQCVHSEQHVAVTKEKRHNTVILFF
jgi:hypothetical protein